MMFKRRTNTAQPTVVFTSREVLKALSKMYEARFLEAGFPQKGKSDVYFDTNGILTVISTEDTSS